LVNDLRTIDSSKRPAFDLVLAELKKLNLWNYIIVECWVTDCSYFIYFSTLKCSNRRLRGSDDWYIKIQLKEAKCFKFQE
jgi:hypothetical protein